MTDRAKKAQEDAFTMRADERITAFLDYVRMNNVALVSEGALIDAVESAVRTILVRGDRSEGEKLQARLYGSLIREGVRELRNDPSRTLSLNCYWAGFDLGIILRPDRSPKEIERIRAKARSLTASALGKRSGEVRRENRSWAEHAEELALEAYSDDPARSNEKIAEHISDSWKLADIGCPGHRTLAKFVAELRSIGRLLQRTRSLQK
jgi:hypothetical protein